MHFKVGERVTFLNESGYGVIRKLDDAALVQVEDETGFLRPYPINELVKIRGDQSSHTVEQSTEFFSEEDHTNSRKSFDYVSKKKNFWEIDLHTHEILETESGMDATSLLRYQLSTFKRFLNSAREKRIKKLVVIHGVGSGVLKTEVRKHLSNQEDLSFFDADFREYGKGATEIEIFYNVKHNNYKGVS